MKLASLTGESEIEGIILSLHDYPLDSLVSVEPACLPPSCTVNLTKSEIENIPFFPADKNQLSGVDNDMHEDYDENFENDVENFDENDDDDADAQGGRFSRGKWTSEEDETLREAVQRHSGRNWKKISDCLEGRTDVQCLHRWQKVLRPGLIKGPWTKEVCPDGDIMNYFVILLLMYA